MADRIPTVISFLITTYIIVAGLYIVWGLVLCNEVGSKTVNARGVAFMTFGIVWPVLLVLVAKRRLPGNIKKYTNLLKQGLREL